MTNSQNITPAFAPGDAVIAQVSTDAPRAYAQGVHDPRAVSIPATIVAVEGDYGIAWCAIELSADRDQDLFPCDFAHIPLDRLTPAHPTPYGAVIIGAESVSVIATGAELHEWATRPGYEWPNSSLKRLDGLSATFDTNGLLELDGADIADGSEFSAWASDAIGAVLPTDHPCHFVTVGQFRG